MSALTNYGESVKLTKETIKTYICDKANDQECQMFFELCKMHNLNPFAGDANLVKYGTQPAQPVVTERAWNRKLNEIKDLEYIQDGVIVKGPDGKSREADGEYYDDDEKLVGGWCRIKIKDRGEVVTRIRLADYDKAQAMWKQIKARMICKTARVQNIRKAIPELGNMYTEAEMDGVNGTDNKQVINVTPNTGLTYSEYKNKIEASTNQDSLKEIVEEIKESLDKESYDALRALALNKHSELSK